MDPRTKLLLEAPVGPTILRLAMPNVVVMVVQASIGLIETFFIAKLGVDALAGMALVFPLCQADRSYIYTPDELILAGCADRDRLQIAHSA